MKEMTPIKPSKRQLFSPDPVDVHVGGRLRLRRKMAGMSQTDLANQIDVTFQQVQKYERGANRIGASRLYKIAHVLDTPISFFFEQAETKLPGYSVAVPQDVRESEETNELIQAYYQINDPRVRRKVLGLARLLSIGEDGFWD